MDQEFIPLQLALIGPDKGKPLSEEMQARVRTAIKNRAEKIESVWANINTLRDEEDN